MTTWNENSFETFTDESTFGESPFGEAIDQHREVVAESEWDSPFGPAEAEEEDVQRYEHEYPQEAYAPDGAGTERESPAFSEAFAEEAEIMRGPTEFPNSCGDVTFDGKPWIHGKDNLRKDQDKEGEASPTTFVPRAEVFEFQLSRFTVDRHELKSRHKQSIADLSRRIQAGVSAGRYSGEPIKVFTYGEASSTASAAHNAPLSRNRAFNVLNAIRCELKNAGVSYPVLYGMYGTSEQHARARGPDNTETPIFRGVTVRAFAPLKESKPCPTCPPQEPRRPPSQTTTTICVSVPRIAPRVAMKLPPDIIPITSLIPGLRLPFAIVTRAQATVQVDDRRSRQRGQFTFNGWGLEVALPAGRTRIDLQAELRASLDLLVKASASLGGKLQLGPLKLTLRIDVSAFAQLVVKLCAQLRLRLDVDLGNPGIPDLRACRLIEARNVRAQQFPFASLAGPAVLIVPGAGYGPAVLTLAGPAVGALGLTSNVIPVPVDKSTVRTLLALGGTLQLMQGGGRREAEHEMLEGGWPQAFEEAESELAPFV